MNYSEVFYAGSGRIVRHLHLMTLILLQAQLRSRDIFIVNPLPTEITPSDVRSGNMSVNESIKTIESVDFGAPSLIEVNTSVFDKAEENIPHYRKMNKRDIFRPNHGFQPKSRKR